MTTYIVTFEVSDASKKSDLKGKLKQYGGYCAIHDNCWAIVSDQNPSKIRDSLSEFLSDADRMFIIRSGTSAAWINSYGKQYDEWLKDKL